MTYEEALDILSTEQCSLRICTGGGVLGCYFTDCNIKASFNKALEALEKVERLEKENKELKEKQIPKKPINETGYYRDNKCPSCFKPIKSGKGSSSHYRNNWCNNCGQCIDWSEV